MPGKKVKSKFAKVVFAKSEVFQNFTKVFSTKKKLKISTQTQNRNVLAIFIYRLHTLKTERRRERILISTILIEV